MSATTITNRFSLEHASLRFGDTVALDDVQLTVSGGELVGVEGRNGSGKTSLLRVLSGACPPSSGRRVGAGRAAYVPATLSPPRMTCRQWLSRMPRRRVNDPALILERLSFDGRLDRGLRNLSFGNLRKVLLADVLGADVSLLVIDEATSGLDGSGVRGLVDHLHERVAHGVAVVVADQLPVPGLEYGRTVIVEQGRIRETSVPSLNKTPARPGEPVVIELSGPVNRLADLLRLAEPLGYRRRPER